MASTLRLNDEDDARLRALAEAEGRSKDEIVRLALADRWSRRRRDQELERVLARVVPRYRNLLDRLGTA
jgi:predicted transcriptional regulator